MPPESYKVVPVSIEIRFHDSLHIGPGTEKMLDLSVAKNFWRNRCRIEGPLLPRLNSKNKTKKKNSQTWGVRAGRWSSPEGSEGLRDGLGFGRIVFMGEDGDIWKKAFFVIHTLDKGFIGHHPFLHSESIL